MPKGMRWGVLRSHVCDLKGCRGYNKSRVHNCMPPPAYLPGGGGGGGGGVGLANVQPGVHGTTW
jgi:hypothetical protein